MFCDYNGHNINYGNKAQCVERPNFHASASRLALVTNFVNSSYWSKYSLLAVSLAPPIFRTLSEVIQELG